MPSSSASSSPSFQALVGLEVLCLVDQARTHIEVLMETLDEPNLVDVWAVSLPAVGKALYHLHGRSEPEVVEFWRRHSEQIDTVVEMLRASPETLAAAETLWAEAVKSHAKLWTTFGVRRIYTLELLRRWWADENAGARVLPKLEDALITVDNDIQYGVIPRPPYDLPLMFQVEAALGTDGGEPAPWWEWFGSV